MVLSFKFSLKKYDCLLVQFISKLVPLFELQRVGFLSLICRPNRVLEIMLFFKTSTNFQFKCLTDIAGIDFLMQTDCRLAVSYNLLSVRFNQRLRVLAFLDALAFLPSLVCVFRSSNWLEREVWDLFGIFFRSHPDLRRILTDYGFEGHPLRKDYPLEGFSETFYSFICEGVVQELFSLSSGSTKRSCIHMSA
jgi:NADH dehydrogenase (ubiquinone) Fe-S protein 3